MWIIGYFFSAAMEESVIDIIEADDCGEQAPIACQGLWPEQIGLLAEHGI